MREWRENLSTSANEREYIFFLSFPESDGVRRKGNKMEISRGRSSLYAKDQTGESASVIVSMLEQGNSCVVLVCRGEVMAR